MKYKFSLPIFVLLVSLTFGSVAYGNGTRPWRLPFDGTVTITNAMNEGLHVNASSEAIDYFAGGGQIPIRAPVGGYVLDVLNVGDFGKVLRITHGSGITSFYAHLSSVATGLTNGSTVLSGQLIAYSGSTGTGGANNHLHYEARVNAVAGNVYTGQSIPVRAVAGNWFNSFYSPLPNFQHNTNLTSGGAQFPDQLAAPSTMSNQSTGSRHLWESESPLDRPLFYVSNSTPSSVVLHTGGSPSTPNSPYAVDYSVKKYRLACSCWVSNPGYYSDSSKAHPLSSADQSDANGQHTFLAYSHNTLRGWSTNNRYIDFMPEKPANNLPHITAISDYGVQETILEFYVPGATAYQVAYRFNNGPITYIHNSAAPSIKHNRNLGGYSRYTVTAYHPVSGWSSWSDWVIIKVAQWYGQ